MIPSTEERILLAAKNVFHKRGFDGTRMQEIADEAGINKALVHYYFRSKNNLFQAVFEDAFSTLLLRLNEIFFSEGTLQQKIEIFLNYYIDFLSQNSFLPMFILNGLYNKPDQLKTFMEKKSQFSQRLLAQIKTQLKTELDIDIDPLHLYINILSVVVFPIVARPLIQSVFGLSQMELATFYEERKKEVLIFIINGLKGYSHEKIQANE